MTVVDLYLTLNFQLSEFLCPCCERVRITEEFCSFVARLQELRDRWGSCLLVTSGYRCPDHNADPQVGGAPKSRHLYADGADLVPGYWRLLGSLSIACGVLADRARDLGFSVVVYDDHVHVDSRPGEPYFKDVRQAA